MTPQERKEAAARIAGYWEEVNSEPPPPRKPWRSIIVGVLLGMIIAIPIVHVAHKALPEITEVRP